jgi:hypothetical protein
MEYVEERSSVWLVIRRDTETGKKVARSTSTLTGCSARTSCTSGCTKAGGARTLSGGPERPRIFSEAPATPL